MGDYFVVRGQHQSGARRTWYINASRDWNAERIVWELGSVTREVTCTLEVCNGTWFPSEVRYYRDGALDQRVIVRSASFNSKSDAARFTPNDLGVEAGSAITIQNAGREHASGRELPTWDGEGVVTFGAWLEDVEKGRRQWGPNHRRTHEKGEFQNPYDLPEQVSRRRLVTASVRAQGSLTRHRGLWEAYVREFKARFRLDETQSTKADVILLECQSRANEILERGRSELLELVSNLADAEVHGRQAAIEALQARLRSKLEPVEAIFHKRLKPQLDLLPTRAQRRAAEEARNPSAPPATQPVKCAEDQNASFRSSFRYSS